MQPEPDRDREPNQEAGRPNIVLTLIWLSILLAVMLYFGLVLVGLWPDAWPTLLR